MCSENINLIDLHFNYSINSKGYNEAKDFIKRIKN